MVFKKSFSTLILLLFSMFGFAGPNPPSPTGKGKPPDLPIDENLTIVLTIVTLYGLYTIYKNIKNKKASI